jgi:hypothetical protein
MTECCAMSETRIWETYTRDGRIVYFIRVTENGRPRTRPIKSEKAFDMLNKGEALYQ